MASEIELARIAQVLNVLRPKWPVQSCLTTLRRHAHHPLADLAVAAVAVAVDERNVTPAALDKPGPWWNLARAEPTPTPPAYMGPSEPKLPAERVAYRANECRAALAARRSA